MPRKFLASGGIHVTFGRAASSYARGHTGDTETFSVGGRYGAGLLQTTALDIRDGGIAAIYIVKNPDKLAHLSSVMVADGAEN